MTSSKSRQKILLIRPPVEGFRFQTIGARYVPTGLMYLMHALHNKKDKDVYLFDSLCWHGDTHIIPRKHLSPMALQKIERSPLFSNVIHYGATWDRIRNVIRSFEPDIVGITCSFSSYYKQAYKTAEIVREERPSAKIFMGGAHATVAWQDAFEHAPIDAIILGEGETTFSRVVEDLQYSALDVWDSITVADYPGLIVRLSDGSITENHKQHMIFDLDSLGFPALDAIDFTRYNNATSLITSRGCPFACTFCSIFAIFGRKFRARSIESVIAELTYYSKRGVQTFNVEDDNFTFDMERVDLLMEAICRTGLDIELRFPNGITALKMTEERLKLMARAGVRQLFFGLESTDAETRRKLKKGFARIDEIEALIHAAKRFGIYAFVSVIIGLPQQTLEDMADGYAETFIRGIADSANPYYPIAGTELFRQSEVEGLLLESDLEWYEPMNFPLEGKSFKRSDVADAFILGLALAHPSYKTYHRKFLQSAQLSTEEVVEALEQLHILVEVKSDDELLLAPHRCFCEEQGLVHEHSDTRGDQYPSEICTLSGRILQMVLQLWSGRFYACEEVACRVRGTAQKCLFRVRPMSQPLESVVANFLSSLSKKIQDTNRLLLPETFEDLALEEYKAFYNAHNVHI